jgi:hypothetical protein
VLDLDVDPLSRADGRPFSRALKDSRYSRYSRYSRLQTARICCAGSRGCS